MTNFFCFSYLSADFSWKNTCLNIFFIKITYGIFMSFTSLFYLILYNSIKNIKYKIFISQYHLHNTYSNRV